jgi:GT2 family glycosyltransferase
MTTARSEAELVIVNDASPDPEICEALAGLARDGCVTLLTNRLNLGFPGAANRGLCLHPERDVVLLNSDTELFGDWLNRLKFAAYSAEDIGTVTPLGDVASITSYPGNISHPHTMAEAMKIDVVTRQVNARRVVEIPVGVGHCLYIKRACLNEVGGFDESNFDKGYGEENDFCLRARGLGWRHVAAADLFVRHRGARSYGPKRRLLTERNRRVLNALHPGYDAMIADFVAADPLLGARRAIDMHRLLEEAIDPVLLLTFALPGGVKRHVEARQSELKIAGHSVLVLQPVEAGGRGNQVVLNLQDSGMKNLVFNLPDELPILRSLLLRLGLSHTEVHHFAGLPGVVLETVAELGIPYDVYIHDYAWICPRLTLVGGAGVYCGEPPVEDCETCILNHGTALEESLTVGGLRARSAWILSRARTVIVPSNDVHTRLARYFPGLPMRVTPWEGPINRASQPAPRLGGRVRVAVIGAISIAKGYQVLLQCARDAAGRDLNLEFVVIGYTFGDGALLATGRVFVTGPYAENEAGTLLEREQCHAAFFPSVTPETWCYALSHALALGLPIVAFQLGAIGERLRTQMQTELLPLLTTPAVINDTLLRLARRIPGSDLQKELSMGLTPTTNIELVSQELSASVTLMTLPVGTYIFSVQGGVPPTTPTEQLSLPALQVGPAPRRSAGTVEFFAGGTASDRWLVRSTDMIIAKISDGDVSLLLTSVRSPESPSLAIDVRPLEAQPRPADPDVQSAAHLSGVLPVQVLAHIQRVGDIYFSNGWAGCVGEKFWIEAFAITSVGELALDSIEYCGITADGSQTPWLTNRMLCGSRGRAIPIIGFAIRLKPEVAPAYDCAYTGKFVSGSTFGPCKDGELCCSDLPGDPLWGIELRIAARGEFENTKTTQENQYSSVA